MGFVVFPSLYHKLVAYSTRLCATSQFIITRTASVFIEWGTSCFDLRILSCAVVFCLGILNGCIRFGEKTVERANVYHITSWIFVFRCTFTAILVFGYSKLLLYLQKNGKFGKIENQTIVFHDFS